MAWHIAPSLVRLRSELNNKYPNRDRTSDGSIGDAAHSSRVSDHNPNSRNSVNALDIDRDGINALWVISMLKKHPSVNYIIYNRVIYSRIRGFKAARYTGSNPHTAHIHVSILQSTSAENNKTTWLGTVAPKPAPAKPSYPAYPGLLKLGSTGTAVGTLQKRLNTRGYTPKLDVDNDFGKKTDTNVRAFQRFAKLTVDGKVGKVTHKALWTLRIT